jgi:hypothetical protein
VTLHEALAQTLLDRGRFAEAKAAVERAIGGGIASKKLDAINTTVARGLSGPSFAKRFEFKSANYHVISDIDRNTCEEAAKILEDSYLAYRANLEHVKNLPAQRFMVYLFSGEAGYRDYCKDLWGAAPSHTAGLYMPVLKQLLIWNLPTRADMMRTVRHEGFHQYLDRLMDDPPLWFNEGNAEYYETAEMSAGQWRLGRVRTDHLATLSRGLMPLVPFLYRGRLEFLTQAGPHYAQSWAFIHFLRHSTANNKKLFDAFWDAFKSVPDHTAALDKVLVAVDLEKLEADFKAHVAGLN